MKRRARDLWCAPVQPRRTVAIGPAAPRSGYTLLEMVAVLALMATLLTLAVGAFLGWGQTHAVNAAEVQMLTGLARAREYAVTQRRETILTATNVTVALGQRGYFNLSFIGDDGVARPLGPTNALPRGVRFALDGQDPASVAFRPDGACADDVAWSDLTTRRFAFVHQARAQTLRRTIEVSRLTGLARVQRPEESLP